MDTNLAPGFTILPLFIFLSLHFPKLLVLFLDMEHIFVSGYKETCTYLNISILHK